MANSWSFLYDEMNYKINDFDVDVPPTDTATNIFEYTYDYDEHGPVAAQEVPMSFLRGRMIVFPLIWKSLICPILPRMTMDSGSIMRM